MDKSIKKIFTPDPLTVSQDSVIHDCIRLMRQRRISSLIICEEDKPVGIYTEADMVRTLNRALDCHQLPICQLMTSPLITADHHINIFEATYLLTRHRIRHLVIVGDEGELVGVLTQSDIIAHYGEDYFLGAKNVSSVMTNAVLAVAVDDNVPGDCTDRKFYLVCSGGGSG